MAAPFLVAMARSPDRKEPPPLLIWLAAIGLAWLIVGFIAGCCWAGWKVAAALLS